MKRTQELGDCVVQAKELEGRRKLLHNEIKKLFRYFRIEIEIR